MADTDEGKQGLFRKDAVEAVGNRNRLNTLSPIIEPRAWVLTAALAFLLATIVAWSFLGRIPITVGGSGIFLRGEQLDTCNARSDGYVASIELKEGDSVKAGQRIATIATGNESAPFSEIVSPKDGRLVSLEVEPGDFVVIGQSSALIISGLPKPSCLAFIPLDQGKSVREGDEVRVTFESADATGGMQGLARVVQVDRFITSRQKALGRVPSHTVVEEIAGLFGPVLAVTVEFEADPTGPGGVKWVAGKGNESLLLDGAPCTIEIVIGEIPPVALVLPGFGGVSGDSR